MAVVCGALATDMSDAILRIPWRYPSKHMSGCGALTRTNRCPCLLHRRPLATGFGGGLGNRRRQTTDHGSRLKRPGIFRRGWGVTDRGLWPVYPGYPVTGILRTITPTATAITVVTAPGYYGNRNRNRSNHGNRSNRRGMLGGPRTCLMYKDPLPPTTLS